MNPDIAPSGNRATAIFVAPSAIRYIDQSGPTISCSSSFPAAGNKQQPTLSANNPPVSPSPEQPDIRVEVVQVDGEWFALDRQQLEFYQRMELEGVCRRVQVEDVPMSQLTDEIKSRIAETIASIKNGAIADVRPIEGYQILNGRNLDNNGHLAEEIDRYSDNSTDKDESSSECGSHYLDWSEDEGDSSDISEGEDVGKTQRKKLPDDRLDSSDDEKEQLLLDD